MESTAAICFSSPLGIIRIEADSVGITAVSFVENETPSSSESSIILEQCKRELEEYFAGKRREFTVPLNPNGTEFQQKVWNELVKIDFAKTGTYLGIAKRLKNPNALRAVGLANGKNPIAIIIPCHRVIGGDGKLTGYAGGLWRKQWLLEHEAKVSGKALSLFSNI